MKRYLLFLSFLSAVVLFYACQKEVSFENGGTPSVGLLQSDISGDCLPKTVTGIYEEGTALGATTNYIDVEVDVLAEGTYTIYTDTVNGIYFRASGIFTTPGLNTVRLAGHGTPIADGISNFVVTYGLTSCTVPVTILPDGATGPAAFTLSTGTGGECMGAVVSGGYTEAVALTASSQVVINVNVTTIGTYTVSTAATNGITFSGTGAFIATGPGTITLTASGTPVAAGTTNIPVTVGTSSCSFPVTVTGPATYTVNCGTAVPNGTYAAGSALTAGNTVSIQVNVATIGGYTITGTVNGMTFSKSGNFTTTGLQTITLAGSGTPTNGGTFNVPLTGGTAPCNFPVTVTGPATFTVNCGTAVVNGDYEEGVALNAGNTVTIDVTVASVGGYTVTGTINGMTFSKSGNFTATGPQTITLAGTGTPAADGTFNVPINSGSTPCTFSVIVDAGIPSIGNWQFKVGTTTYQGTFTEAEFDNTTPPFLLFDAYGETPAGVSFEILLVDFSGTIQNNETYDCSTAAGGNTGGVHYDGVPPTIYYADFIEGGNTMIIKVTTHNTATKTITGTFSGKAFDENDNLVDITSGTFTVTYP